MDATRGRSRVVWTATLREAPTAAGSARHGAAHRSGRSFFSVVEHHAARESVPDSARELAEPPKVPSSYRGRCLDLDPGQCSAPLLEDEIHFHAVPVTEVRTVRSTRPASRPGVSAPERRTFRGADPATAGPRASPRRRLRAARTPAPVSERWSFGVLISRPGRLLCQAGRRSSRKIRSSRGQVVPDCRTRGLKGGRQSVDVEEPGGLGGRVTEEARQGFQRPDPRQIPHVMLHQRRQVVAVPAGPAPSRREGERRRVATGGDPFGQLPSQPLARRQGKALAEQGVEKIRRRPRDLRLRQRVEPHDPEAAGQGVREPRQEQHVGGTPPSGNGPARASGQSPS